MSGIIHKVKEALSGEKNTPEAAAANRGNNGQLMLLACIHWQDL